MPLEPTWLVVMPQPVAVPCTVFPADKENKAVWCTAWGNGSREGPWASTELPWAVGLVGYTSITTCMCVPHRVACPAGAEGCPEAHRAL